MATIWKIAPGDKARVWKETCPQGCITINWMNQTDFGRFKTKEQLKKALKAKGNGAQGADSIWYFVHDVQRGHTVVANKGKSGVVGIGVVRSAYLPPGHHDNPRNAAKEHRHALLVDWLITEPVDLHEQVFTPQIPPTVQPLNQEQCRKIKEAYLKQNPEMKKTLDKLFSVQKVQNEPPGSEMKTLLEQFGQLIVYGPPGTGKTREAKRVALALLSGDDSAADAAATDDDIEKQLAIP